VQCACNAATYLRRALVVALILVWMVWGLYMIMESFAGFWYVTGEPAAAHVDQCRTLSSDGYVYDECRGTWRFDDGRSGRGTIHGVDASAEGQVLRVRAGSTSALAGRPDIVPVLLIAAPLLAGTVALRRWRRLA
jgi:hypothetical protein